MVLKRDEIFKSLGEQALEDLVKRIDETILVLDFIFERLQNLKNEITENIERYK
jgi:hypothetical protein